MSLETETVLDRRRLKRSQSLWRTLAIVAVVAAVVAFIVAADGGPEADGSLFASQQIARVSVEGLITEDREQLRMLKRIASNDNVKGLIVFINSPGGTTTGGEALFDALRAVAAKKPVVAQFGTVAASAAYITGLACDYIVTRGNTITGSIGVIMQWPEVSELLSKLGVKMNEIKSGPLKATPSPFAPLDDRTRTITQEMIMEGQRWFLGLVASRRGVNPVGIDGLVEGRVFSGREALALKLADELGGEAEAVRWLQDKRNVPKDLKVVDWKPRRASSYGLGSAFSGAVGSMVKSGIRAAVEESGFSAFSLDGLVSVWHPAEN